jgi:hypothetical protein
MDLVLGMVLARCLGRYFSGFGLGWDGMVEGKDLIWLGLKLVRWSSNLEYIPGKRRCYSSLHTRGVFERAWVARNWY